MTPAWHRDAACRNHPNPDLWFPGPGQTAKTEQALAICRTCPVITACAEWADQHDPLYGTWAGITKQERDKNRGHAYARTDPLVAAALKRCGTPAGYARHRRNGEEACQACKTATAECEAERARRRREKAETP